MIKQKRKFLIPLFAAIPVALLSIVMILEALCYNGTSYFLPFVDNGGVFKFTDIRVFGIRLYYILMIIGLMVAVIVSLQKREQYGYTKLQAAVLTILYFLQAFLGAKILFGVEKVIGAGTLKAWNMSGLSLFGTLYLSLIFVPIFAVFFHKKVTDTFDFITPTWLILLSFVRFGCFISGCCGARQMVFHGFPVRLPVQLFEVICDLCILSLCLWIDQPKQEKNRKEFRAFPLLLVTYCFTRFLLEFLRNNEITSLGITISQVHCVAFLLIGIVSLLKIRGKVDYNKGKNPRKFDKK